MKIIDYNIQQEKEAAVWNDTNEQANIFTADFLLWLAEQSGAPYDAEKEMIAVELQGTMRFCTYSELIKALPFDTVSTIMTYYCQLNADVLEWLDTDEDEEDEESVEEQAWRDFRRDCGFYSHP